MTKTQASTNNIILATFEAIITVNNSASNSHRLPTCQRFDDETVQSLNANRSANCFLCVRVIHATFFNDPSAVFTRVEVLFPTFV